MLVAPCVAWDEADRPPVPHPLTTTTAIVAAASARRAVLSGWVSAQQRANFGLRLRALRASALVAEVVCLRRVLISGFRRTV
jgi:hypothetical protein